MSLLYRAQAAGTRVVELVPDNGTVLCVLTDTLSKTAETVVCMTIPQAERYAEQFLYPKKRQ